MSMDKNIYSFEDYVLRLPPELQPAVLAIHENLLRDGCKCKVESKVSGLFASYSHPKTRRSMLNFGFRKGGAFVRLYADNHSRYLELLHGLPENMAAAVAKSPDCKRLKNPLDCSPTCPMGYDFQIRDTHFQKCRYSCFQFLLNTESVETIATLIEHERKYR